ncbi:41085_t:CDS:2 [Gigaspora margarita]|uniref:41085_t:CDS:1 n=1 Tax=Gigaspora margarita TaxID=4874 RepID=A0ABN7ULU9_GIGMA|nr:41085_t:CDS:2 [Gigaspora margarita]
MEANLKNLVKITVKYVLEHGGVVRGFENWGTIPLATRTRRYQEYHTDG